MGQAASEFAPGGHALGLQGAVFLLQEIFGHAVEGGGQFAQFIARFNFNFGGQIAGGDAARSFGKRNYRARDTGGKPEAGQHGNQNSQSADQHGGRDDAALQFDERTPRTPDQ